MKVSKDNAGVAIYAVIAIAELAKAILKEIPEENK